MLSYIITYFQETTFSNDSLMPTVSSCPPLRTVGRSRTEPGKGDEPCQSDPVRSTKASLECDSFHNTYPVFNALRLFYI
uniref:Uncharacterized protein n=1 Tax=Parascaris equorum TaxID=6256 RepID=A0A914S005_PAREQ